MVELSKKKRKKRKSSRSKKPNQQPKKLLSRKLKHQRMKLWRNRKEERIPGPDRAYFKIREMKPRRKSLRPRRRGRFTFLQQSLTKPRPQPVAS